MFCRKCILFAVFFIGFAFYLLILTYKFHCINSSVQEFMDNDTYVSGINPMLCSAAEILLKSVIVIGRPQRSSLSDFCGRQR